MAEDFWLVTGGDDNKLRVWTPPTQSQATNESPEKPDGEENPEEAAPDDEQADPTKELLVREVTGHSQPITSLRAMPGQLGQVVSGSRDGTMRRWNLTNGQQMTQFNHGGPVTAIAVRSDGQKFASASENKTARIWNANGQQAAQLKGDVRTIQQRDRLQQEVRAATTRVNVAKQQLKAAEDDLPKKQEAAKKADEALAAANKAVEEKTQKMETALSEKNAAESVALEASKMAKAALEKKEAAEARRDDVVAQLALANDRISQLTTAVNLAPQNERLKELLEQTRTKAAELQKSSEELNQAIAEPTKAVQQESQKANQAAQAAAEKQKPYNDALTELKTAESEQNLTNQQQVLAAVELKRAEALPAQRKERVTKFEQQLEALQSQFDEANGQVQEAEQPILSLDFSPNGELLATAGNYSSVHTWDVESGKAVAAYAGHTAVIHAVRFLSDDVLLSGSDDQTARTWVVAPEWRLEATIGNVDQPQLVSGRVTALDFSRDSQSLLVASGIPSRSGDLHVFDLAKGEPLASIKDAHSDVIYSAHFSPDDKRVASAGADKYVRVFDWSNETLLRRLEGHTNYVLSVGWQGDGTTLVSASADATIKLWDAENGDQKRTIRNMTKPRTAVAFIGETTNIVSGGGDQRVRIHNSTNGGTVRNFNTWSSWLHCVAVTPDGRFVAAGSADGSIAIWNGTNSQLLHKLELETADQR